MSKIRHLREYFVIGELLAWGAYVWRDDKSKVTFRESLERVRKPTAKPKLLFDKYNDVVERVEGACSRAEQNIYERDRNARQECLDHYGYECQACGADLAAIYGKIAAGFIHVHHLVLLSSIKRNYVVDPFKDLVPVCPTCHGVMHLKDPPYTPEEIKKLIAANRR
jgi:predicted HNH restriction endonuclease